MSQPVVKLEGVGKRYRLGEYHGGSDLRGTVAGWADRLRGRPRPERRDLWSLCDVSLTVGEGEAVGILGANGAGKSTLLKIVSGITTPTEGRCRTRGRIGSLLEVGTGFHGELTGRENTYLNGAILGMSRREVTQRLDDIVDYAGVGQFMDTPVKRYSSGMYLRLGFAIAAHLAADILVVDEVLAVGDAEFQRRCMGTMSELERSGRTVLFVSHNLEALVRLCPTAVWLDHGTVRVVGPAQDVVLDYTRSASDRGTAGVTYAPDRGTDAQITAITLVDEHGDSQRVIAAGRRAYVDVELMANAAVPGLDVAVVVSSTRGPVLLDELLSDSGRARPIGVGRHRLRCPIPPIFAPGDYTVGVWLGVGLFELEVREHAFTFTIDGDLAARPTCHLRMGTEWAVELTGSEPVNPP